MPDDEPLTGPTDIAAPWTIKSVATETRRAVTDAARREGLTVGQWLEKRVREWMGVGSPAIDAAPMRAPTDLAVELVSQVVNAAVTLANAPNVPRSLRSRVNRLLRDSLPAPTQRMKEPVSRALEAPAPDA